MDFYELIKKRESIRKYDPSRTVDGETLKRILEAELFQERIKVWYQEEKTRTEVTVMDKHYINTLDW